MCMIDEHANKLNKQFYHDIQNDIYFFSFTVNNFLELFCP